MAFQLTLIFMAFTRLLFTLWYSVAARSRCVTILKVALDVNNNNSTIYLVHHIATPAAAAAECGSAMAHFRHF